MLLPLLLALQTTPVPPVQKGTALPPPGTEEAAVLAPVNALFAALAQRSGTAMAAPLYGTGGITVVIERPDGTRTLRQQDFARWTAGMALGPERFEERMPAPAIEIDGGMAMVWGDYVFLIDGKVAHCGVNHLSLVRADGAWKIANIAWTQRTTGCPAQ